MGSVTGRAASPGYRLVDATTNLLKEREVILTPLEDVRVTDIDFTEIDAAINAEFEFEHNQRGATGEPRGRGPQIDWSRYKDRMVKMHGKGMSLPAIAVALGLKPGAVGSYWRRNLRVLHGS